MQIKNLDYTKNCELLSRISIYVVKDLSNYSLENSSSRKDFQFFSVMKIGYIPSEFILLFANIFV